MKTTALPSRLITIKNPCCGGVWRLRALDDLPRERYARRCSGCGFVFLVNRSSKEYKPGKFVDVWSVKQLSLEGQYRR